MAITEWSGVARARNKGESNGIETGRRRERQEQAKKLAEYCIKNPQARNVINELVELLRIEDEFVRALRDELILAQ